jgi:hypothetical protein
MWKAGEKRNCHSMETRILATRELSKLAETSTRPACVAKESGSILRRESGLHVPNILFFSLVPTGVHRDNIEINNGGTIPPLPRVSSWHSA